MSHWYFEVSRDALQYEYCGRRKSVIYEDDDIMSLISFVQRFAAFAQARIRCIFVVRRRCHYHHHLSSDYCCHLLCHFWLITAASATERRYVDYALPNETAPTIGCAIYCLRQEGLSAMTSRHATSDGRRARNFKVLKRSCLATAVLLFL